MDRKQQFRKDNIKHILNDHFGGDKNKLATRLNKSQQTIDKYLSTGRTARPISDSVARQIEKSLHLKMYSLDVEARDGTSTYYIHVNLAGYKIYEFLKALHTFEIVQEACGLFGGVDVIAKIEATEEEFQELILHEIQVFPTVKKTKTLRSLNQSRWQRSQVECFKLKSPKKIAKNFIEQYIIDRKQDLQREIALLESEQQIIIPDYEMHTITPVELINNTNKEIMFFTFPRHDKFKHDKELFNAEREKIKQGVIIKRIIILDYAISYKEYNNEFKDKIKEYEDIGEKVKIMKERWMIKSKNKCLEDKGAIIFDKKFVYTQRMEDSILKYSEDAIQLYIKLFNMNWNKAKVFSSYEP